MRTAPRRLFPLTLVLLGSILLAAGGYTVSRGFDARAQVGAELQAQNIRTAEDSGLPDRPVDSPETAKSLAATIDHHVRVITGGLTFAEMGRYMALDGSPKGTHVEADAVKGPTGRPLPNPIRSVAFEGSALRTSLFTSVMAFEVGNLVIGIGALLAALGMAFAALGLFLRILVRTDGPAQREPEGQPEASIDLLDLEVQDLRVRQLVDVVGV